jgi:hypothetical protein
MSASRARTACELDSLVRRITHTDYLPSCSAQCSGLSSSGTRTKIPRHPLQSLFPDSSHFRLSTEERVLGNPKLREPALRTSATTSSALNLGRSTSFFTHYSLSMVFARSEFGSMNSTTLSAWPGRLTSFRLNNRRNE